VFRPQVPSDLDSQPQIYRMQCMAIAIGIPHDPRNHALVRGSHCILISRSFTTPPQSGVRSCGVGVTRLAAFCPAVVAWWHTRQRLGACTSLHVRRCCGPPPACKRSMQWEETSTHVAEDLGPLFAKRSEGIIAGGVQ